jgi:hypothetical protein
MFKKKILFNFKLNYLISIRFFVNEKTTLPVHVRLLAPIRYTHVKLMKPTNLEMLQ